MCGCSANFDGHNSVEEIEETKYLDFDGDIEEGVLDGDFDNASGKREERLDGSAMAYVDYIDCIKNKPRLRTRNTWYSTCERVHGKPSDSELSEDELLVMENIESSDEPKSNLGKIALIGGGVLALGLITVLVVKAVKK